MEAIPIEQLRKQFTANFNPGGDEQLSKAIADLNEGQVRALEINIEQQTKDLAQYGELVKEESLKGLESLSDIEPALTEMYKQQNIMYILTHDNVRKPLFDSVIKAFENSIKTMRGNVGGKIKTLEEVPRGDAESHLRKYLKYKTKYLTLRDKLNV